MATALPKLYGPYKAIRLIGQGGMGCVYEALHSQIQRRVALKVLSDNLAGDRKLATRFLNEARAVNIVSHPSLVVISDFGEQDGIPFIVMEYLEGETLSDRVKHHPGQPMLPATALLIVRQIASGLDAAHAKGIVHRDLKPSDIARRLARRRGTYVDGLRTYCGQVREGALRVCDPAPAPIAAYSCEQVGAFGWSRTYLAGRSL